MQDGNNKNEGLSSMPCFRSAFLFSIPSGIVAGLACFMLTSKVKKASNIAVGSFLIVTICKWSHCRYNYALEKFKVDQLREAIQRRS